MITEGHCFILLYICPFTMQQMIQTIRIFGIVLLLHTFFACSKTERRSVAPAFYAWKTTLRLSAAEQAYLDALQCQKLYIKFLDIGKNPASGEIEPRARLQIADTISLKGKTVIPTVFITNEVFLHQSPENTAWLASQIATTLLDVGADVKAKSAGTVLGFPEIQFDCDWTPSTQGAFFLFLQKIRPLLPNGILLSTTIRLHQYKFPQQTGVPPLPGHSGD